MQTTKRGKGNRPINKSDAKRIEDGRIVEDLPLVPYKVWFLTKERASRSFR